MCRRFVDSYSDLTMRARHDNFSGAPPGTERSRCHEAQLYLKTAAWAYNGWIADNSGPIDGLGQSRVAATYFTTRPDCVNAVRTVFGLCDRLKHIFLLSRVLAYSFELKASCSPDMELRDEDFGSTYCMLGGSLQASRMQATAMHQLPVNYSMHPSFRRWLFHINIDRAPESLESTPIYHICIPVSDRQPACHPSESARRLARNGDRCSSRVAPATVYARLAKFGSHSSFTQGP